jgi:hypothetical protein
MVDRLPCFAFDDRNFYRSRPVQSWKWFSSEVPRVQAENKLIGHAENGTIEHPGTIPGDVTMAGAGDSEKVLSEGASDVLDEKRPLFPLLFDDS